MAANARRKEERQQSYEDGRTGTAPASSDTMKDDNAMGAFRIVGVRVSGGAVSGDEGAAGDA